MSCKPQQEPQENRGRFKPGFDPPTDERAALLAEIRADEYERANAISRKYFKLDLDQLDARRLRIMVQGVKEDREPHTSAEGTCFQCGGHVPGGGRECRPYHEGMSPAGYNRAMGKYFLSR